MIKILIRDDKFASIRFNHKEECNEFKQLMLQKKEDHMKSTKDTLYFPFDIKVKDERREK